MYLFSTPLTVASEKQKLTVTIDVSYSKPSDFSLDPPNYRAGSSVTLTCRVEGTRQGLTYLWSSNCTHNCFVKGRTTQNVTRNGLYSVDSGTHMCNVTDALGHSGNASIVMTIIGKGNCRFSDQLLAIKGKGNCRFSDQLLAIKDYNNCMK